VNALRAAVVAVALAVAAAAPAAIAAPPKVGAPQAVLIEPLSGDVLFARAADRERPVASATKLMTALVVLERAELDDVYTSPGYDGAAVESTIDLKAGERLTVSDLLTALLLESANDAAVTLAEGVAGSRAEFVELMNERADRLGLGHTHFANPIGLDSPENYSSAADLATLTVRLRRDAFFRRTVDRPRAQLTSGAEPRELENSNDLLGGQAFVNGVKTGHTNLAGYVLVGSASRGGVTVISTVLGAPSKAARDADTLALLRYGLRQFRRVTVVDPNRVVARSDVKYREEDRIELVPAARRARVLRVGERARVTVSAPAVLEGPIPQGARVGTVIVRVRGRVTDRVPLLTAQPVPKVSWLERAVDFMVKPGTLAGLAGLAGLVLAGAVAGTAIRRRRRQPKAHT